MSYEITADSVEVLDSCNHQEADTRLVLHAGSHDSPVVVVSKDTDVLVLLAYAANLLKPKEPWFMKISKTDYIDIKQVVKYLRAGVCSVLPQIHAITGCDTTS